MRISDVEYGEAKRYVTQDRTGRRPAGTGDRLRQRFAGALNADVDKGV